MRKVKLVLNVRAFDGDAVKKVEAIKRLRTVFPLGLKEAKDIVDAGVNANTFEALSFGSHAYPNQFVAVPMIITMEQLGELVTAQLTDSNLDVWFDNVEVLKEDNTLDLSGLGVRTN